MLKFKNLALLGALLFSVNSLNASDSDDSYSDVLKDYGFKWVKLVGLGEWKESIYQEVMVENFDTYLKHYPKFMLKELFDLLNRNDLERVKAMGSQSDQLVERYVRVEKDMSVWQNKLAILKHAGGKKRSKSRKITHASHMVQEYQKIKQNLNTSKAALFYSFRECAIEGYLRRYSIFDLGMIDEPTDRYDIMRSDVNKYVKYKCNVLKKPLTIVYQNDHLFCDNDPVTVEDLNAISLKEIIPEPYKQNIQNCTLHLVVKTVEASITDSKFASEPLEQIILWENPAFVDK